GRRRGAGGADVGAPCADRALAPEAGAGQDLAAPAGVIGTPRHERGRVETAGGVPAGAARQQVTEQSRVPRLTKARQNTTEIDGVSMNLIETIEQEEISRLGKKIPVFAPGDTVIVNVSVVEGERKRAQAYEGVDDHGVAGGEHGDL